MLWQQARTEALRMAEEIVPQYQGKVYTIVVFESDEAYRSAHPAAEWSREDHKIVMQALYRVLDRKGVKVVRLRSE
jgi:hypothetical protein